MFADTLKSGVKPMMRLNKVFATTTCFFFFLFATVLVADESVKRTDSNQFAAYLDQLPKPAKVVEREEVDPMFSEAGDEPDAIVTGVRALSSQNISNVKPDAEAVKALEKYAIDKNQASDFASKLGLKTRQVEYLVKAEEEPAPAKQASDEEF
jgi:hypothetical protein